MPGIDKYLVVLQRTNDGNDLSPQHLKLLELGVNGHLNEAGLAAVDKLYESVVAGTYTKPYHLDVKFMTYDHEGYIYFKDQQVEHYSHPWAYSLDAKKDLTKLQHQCLYLESIGELNGFPYMLCDYKMKGKFGAQFCESEKQELDRLRGDSGILFSQVCFSRGGVQEGFLLPGHVNRLDIQSSEKYRDLMEFRNVEPYDPAAVTSFAYGAVPFRNATERELDYLNCCMDYLNDNGLLNVLSKEEYEMAAEQMQDSGEDYER